VVAYKYAGTAQVNPIVKFSKMKIKGLGPLPLDFLTNINNQKIMEVNNKSAANPAAAPFTKSAEINPPIFAPSIEKKRIKKM
jgi:hypothetical protein